LNGGDVVAVAYSGGKDSALTLRLLTEAIGPMRGVELSAILVDEGIAGYRDVGLPMARDFCNSLDVNLEVRRLSDELGITIDKVAKLDRVKSICSYCGVFRRKVLNGAAREMGANYLATGLNLDDTVQGIVMNIFRGDIERLARMGPHENLQEGLVPRVQPLRKIPEKESLLFCILEKIAYNENECPYAYEAVRNEYREMLAKVENEHPGTRFSILSSYDSIRESLSKSFPQMKLGKCDCGEPAVGAVCMACQMLGDLGK